ncbi:MAG TPA: hypothetical protein VFI06_04660 [Chitinophagaceae bacterium]|nr:hypothetical protein [Chitinophagaceae bacterium]
MPEISEKPTWKEWACRILITLDLYFIVQGFASFFLTKHQLVSPLIPQSILYDVSANQMKAGLATTIGLAAGIWTYFFKKRIAAIIILGIAALSSEIVFWVFNK